MKKLVLGLVIGLLAGFAVASWVKHNAAAEAKPEGAAEAKPEEKSGEGPLHFTPAKMATAGIVVAAPRTIELAPEVEAFGRVLDPTPFVALVAEEATARASLAASEKELERVQKLFAAGGNASAQAVEAAEAAAAKDRAAVASAQIRLLAGWGPALAQHADLGQIRSILENGAALIRIDLLPGTNIDAGVKSARVTLLGSDESFAVRVLGPAPVADPQVQGQSFLAVLHNHSLPAGATLRVAVRGQGASTAALTVPRAAIVYHQGSAWLYVRHKEEFERRRVTLGRSLGEDVVVSHGIAAEDNVAVHGAGQLLSAELATGEAPDER